LSSVKKPRVFKLAQDITEPNVAPASVSEPIAEPIPDSVAAAIVETTIPSVAESATQNSSESVAQHVSFAEPVAEPVPESVAEPATEPAPELAAEPVAEPVSEPLAEPPAELISEPKNIQPQGEMWRGIELPPLVNTEEENAPSVRPEINLHDMPPLEDEGDDNDDMPELDQGENEEADDEEEAEDEAAEEEEAEEEPTEQQPSQENTAEEPVEDEDCQFLHNENEVVEGELASFSQKIYDRLQTINNFIFAVGVGFALGFIIINAFKNGSVNNLNEL